MSILRTKINFDILWCSLAELNITTMILKWWLFYVYHSLSIYYLAIYYKKSFSSTHLLNNLFIWVWTHRFSFYLFRWFYYYLFILMLKLFQEESFQPDSVSFSYIHHSLSTSLLSSPKSCSKFILNFPLVALKSVISPSSTAFQWGNEFKKYDMFGRHPNN